MFVDVWWFVLLPVLFGLGWFAARLDSRMEQSSTEVPDAYFKSLNYLLNEQPDKAIDSLVDVVKLDPETTDVHFALGNLFRRRGENERAIRVHKSLVDRTDLSEAQREHALFELGQDYLKAGLLDRAEDAFNRLEGSDYRAAALDHRLKIAQTVRDWQQSIDLAERLDRQPGEAHQSMIAHFYCEQAEQLRAGQADKGTSESSPDVAAAELLARAIEADPAHVRAQLMRGELAMARGDAAAAIEAWARVLDNAPRYAALCAAPWLEAHRQQGVLREGADRLEEIQAAHPSVDVLNALYDAHVDHLGEAAGLEYLKEALTSFPSLLGYRQFVVARAKLADSDDEKASAELGERVLQPQTDRLARYVCSHCGFSARRYYWQCPGCTRWDSYSPRRAEEISQE
jgi:lipopolysaccharide biosynthesis regulator YciM